MKKAYSLLISILFLFFAVSCGKKPAKAVIPYVDETSYEEDEYYDDYVEVPYTEEGGVKTIRVTLNGIGVDMIFDTGCSGTLISLAEAQYLYSKGLLTDDDILGTSNARIADGSVVENMVINLREITIADKLACRNVTATVCLNETAPLLLGNEVLNRATSYTIDNTKNVIKFKLE